jgi:hypothetical protein
MLRMVIGGCVLGSAAALAFGCGDTMTIGERETSGSGGRTGDAPETGGATSTGGAKAAGGATSSAGAVATGGETDTGEPSTGQAGTAGAPEPPDVTCEGTGQRLFANSVGTCLLRDDGTPVCWGAPLWTGRTPDEPFVSLSIGQDAACGIQPDCRVVCWGSTPQAMPPAGLYGREVVVAQAVSCALDLDQRVQCWGLPSFDEDYANHEFRALFQGDSVCGILGEKDADAGGALCWGSPLASLSLPSQPGPFIELGSADHACGRLESGELRCWGNTYYGATEPPAGDFGSVITGDGHFSCALDLEGHATCWGLMYFEDEDPALLEAPDGEFESLVAGGAHVCGLMTDGQVRCWGYGIATDARDEIPYVRQASPPDGEFVEIAAGYWHTCGLHADGSVECWGAGEPGDPVDVNGVHQGQSDPPEL